MAESYNNPPPSGSHQIDDEPRIDGDGQEVNALRFLGAGGPGPNPPPPAPSITPSQSSLSGGVGVSQPLQPSPQNPPAPPQTPHNHPPPSIPQTPGGVSSVYDPYSDPSGAAGGGGHHPHHSHGMQVPPGPASNPYPHGMMPGAPMMMMPGYPYGMYANPYGFMPPAYPPIPPQPLQPQQNSQAQLAAASAMMIKLRVDHPNVYRKWYDKYMLHKRDPDRIPCPPLPQVAGFPPLGGLVSSQTLPNYHGRSRKKSTRSSINGDVSFSQSMRPNDSFAYYNSLPTHPVPNSSRNSRRPNSTRASVDGDNRSTVGGLPDDDYEIDGAPNSMSVDVSNSSLANHVGNNSMLHSTFHGHNTTGYDRDRPTQSGRSSRADGYRLPQGDIYGGVGARGGMEHESLNRFDSSSIYGDFKSISQMEQREPSPARRMTPMKFSTFHCIAAMSPLGHMIRIKSSGTVLELVKIKQFVSHLPEYREMESFPGPLTQISTHKNTVIQFCKRKIKEARSNPAQLDRENYILLWEFLMLMLRQNGMVVGSDIAELLLNAVEQQKQVLQQQKQSEAQTKEGRDFVEGNLGGDSNSAPLTDKEEGEGESSEEEESVPIPHPPYNNPPLVSSNVPAVPKDEKKLVEEFCSHLLYGHKKDALDFAMDHGLWGHALFFASKMDERSYGHVLARFANGIPLSSPLQTLYHIMCGKQPASVTSCGEGDNAQGATFGDWKPHLAMLLSNSGYKPEVEHRAILTLGDTLQQRNHVFAAQFCYLMGHEEFSKESRLGTLLGYSPQGKNKLEATQMTEVYEFARKLADPNFNLGVSFQQSKLEYAKTLVSYGFVEEALAYCEEITKVLRQSGRYGEQEREELIKLSGNTLKIAERIAVADESGTASGTWVEELRRLAMEPTLYAAGELEDSLRKLSLQSSSNNQDQQGQGEGQQQQFDLLSYSSSSAGGNNQQQAGSNVGDEGTSGNSNAGASIPTIYDHNYAQQQQTPQQQPQGDGNTMGRQYSGENVGLMGIDSTQHQQQQQVDGQGMQQQQPPQMILDNSWGQSQGQGQQSMMNGGLHLTQQQQQYEPPTIPIISQGQQGGYGVTQGNGGYQQQQQPPQGMMDGEYCNGPQSYGGDNKAAQPTINNNNWYNPYDSQPQLGGGIGAQPDYSGKDSGQSHQNSSPVKKKSVRFEDQRSTHNPHQYPSNPQRLGGEGNSSEVQTQSVVRSRLDLGVVKNPADLKSVLKASSMAKDQQQQKVNLVLQNGNGGDVERCSSERRDDRSGSYEVEYKSTYPIDEPINEPLRSISGGGMRLAGGGGGTPLNHPYPLDFQYKKQQPQRLKTYQVDKQCCDVNSPCEDHGDQYLEELAEGNFFDEEDDELQEEEDEEGGNLLHKGNNDTAENGNGRGPLVQQQQNFSRSQNQNKTDSKPPSPSSNASSGGAAKKDKDKSVKDKGWFSGLFTRLKPKNQMILPEDTNPTIVWDPKEKRWINTADGEDDEIAPAGPPPKDIELIGGPKMQIGGGGGGMPNGPMQQLGGMMMPPQQQQHQGMGMMYSQPQQQQVNKYKLQKNRGLKGYVDVFNPNASSGGGGGGAPSPSLPVPVFTTNGVSSGAPVPNFFIPPAVPQGGQGGDNGPVSFLTAPVLEDSVNSTKEAPNTM